MNNGYDFNAHHDSRCEGPYCNCDNRNYGHSNLYYSGDSGISDIPASWFHHFLGMGVLLEVRNGNIYGIS